MAKDRPFDEDTQKMIDDLNAKSDVEIQEILRGSGEPAQSTEGRDSAESVPSAMNDAERLTMTPDQLRQGDSSDEKKSDRDEGPRRPKSDERDDMSIRLQEQMIQEMRSLPRRIAEELAGGSPWPAASDPTAT